MKYDFDQPVDCSRNFAAKYDECARRNITTLDSGRSWRPFKSVVDKKMGVDREMGG